MQSILLRFCRPCKPAWIQHGRNQQQRIGTLANGCGVKLWYSLRPHPRTVECCQHCGNPRTASNAMPGSWHWPTPPSTATALPKFDAAMANNVAETTAATTVMAMAAVGATTRAAAVAATTTAVAATLAVVAVVIQTAMAVAMAGTMAMALATGEIRTQAAPHQ